MNLISKLLPLVVAAGLGTSPIMANPDGESTIYNFEDGNAALDGWSLSISNVSNVSKSGINTSSKCIKCVPESGAGYGGYIAKWNTLNFNGSQGISMMVYSTSAVGDVILGLRQGSSDASNGIERTCSVSETGKWVKLYFDLTGVSGSYASFNIKFGNEVTYYVDNINYIDAADIPEQYKNTSGGGTGGGSGEVGSFDAGSAEAAFDADYYNKALWMTTRFYGAQRSGNGPNWLLIDHSKNFAGYSGGKSYIKDADGSYDLTGGWFDCGDFVKFGQTEFYSCYMLLLGYSEFADGYVDLYSPDYKGYVSSGDYTYEGGKGAANGIPDVLDECKYATDFFQKCIRSSSQFYYQVGDGNADHQQWTTSVYKSKNLSVSAGGESDGSRPVYSISSGGTSMVAICGASLAAMYRLYKDYDADYAAKCLAKAKVCEQFINRGSLGNIGSNGGGFYPAKDEYAPDLVIFYSEMYRATGTESYKTKAATYFSQMKASHGWSLCYNNTNDIADYVYYMISDNKSALSQLQAYANSYKGDGYFLNSKGDNTWGPLRYTANQAFLWALYSKAMGSETLNAYTLRTVDYIIGDNANKFSFVTGLG
ncbi:MAG: glycoside hydrolase family 9 protein, partial [Bacteroidales bacterium]|nr:glycoside hydrolase family 9 protein [Bacteroidales bacterium]